CARTPCKLPDWPWEKRRAGGGSFQKNGHADGGAVVGRTAASGAAVRGLKRRGTARALRGLSGSRFLIEIGRDVRVAAARGGPSAAVAWVGVPQREKALTPPTPALGASGQRQPC